eukprot:7698181-Heterocapsa_arctica.AAC.1
MPKDKIDKLTDTNSKMMQEKMEETIRTKNIMQELLDTLRGIARTEMKPVETDKEKEKEEKRLRDLNQAGDDQD